MELDLRMVLKTFMLRDKLVVSMLDQFVDSRTSKIKTLREALKLKSFRVCIGIPVA